MCRTIEFKEDRLLILDQTRLPQETEILELTTTEQVIEAIRSLRVRGAPAIGVAGAYAMVLASRAFQSNDIMVIRSGLREIAQNIITARPTAVNLKWAIERLIRVLESSNTYTEVYSAFLSEAELIQYEDETANRDMGAHGAALIPVGSSVLTHCNTGALATSNHGTAFGVIRTAWGQGRLRMVYATETRPVLQGSRLTAWELVKEGIPGTLIVDSAAGALMSHGGVDCVIVGADRIAANGDVANKIGTYTLAVLARQHAIPFYVAAPISTVDLGTSTGRDIPIEERSPEEITQIEGRPLAPENIAVYNPAFDVTPHDFITAIITEQGIARAPYIEALFRACTQSD